MPPPLLSSHFPLLREACFSNPVSVSCTPHCRLPSRSSLLWMQREPVPQSHPRHPWANLQRIQPRRGCPSCATYSPPPVPTQVTKTLKLPPHPQLFPPILHLFLTAFPVHRSLQFYSCKSYQNELTDAAPPLFFFARDPQGKLDGDASS